MRKIAHMDGEREQSVSEHLKNVAEMTAKFCKNYKIPQTNISEYAYQVGLAHDIGKYSETFQRKIRGTASLSVDHSTAGAKELIKYRMTAGAFAVAGHHGGIPNGWDDTSTNLMDRVKYRELDIYEDYKDEITIKKVNQIYLLLKMLFLLECFFLL